MGAGKEGTIYVVDRENMGHFNSNDQVVQELVHALPGNTDSAGNYGTPTYWNGSVYFCADADSVRQFSLTNGLLSNTPMALSANTYAFPGATLAVSSHGSTGGIVWALERPSETESTVLHAYDAANVATELYNSNQAGSRDSAGLAVKFTVPTVANGKVYVGTQTELTVYGLLP